ncbi:MAG: 30S ribosomal protein S20 [Acidobacteriota bacterium]|jgi:small subunit ribosomal protein S20
MANHKSALKRARQNARRRQRNRSNTSRMRTQVKVLRKAVEAGETDRARELLPATLALLDRSVQSGVLKENAASRRKSRLTRLVNRSAS